MHVDYKEGSEDYSYNCDYFSEADTNLLLPFCLFSFLLKVCQFLVCSNAFLKNSLTRQYDNNKKHQMQVNGV